MSSGCKTLGGSDTKSLAKKVPSSDFSFQILIDFVDGFILLNLL